MTVDQDRRFRSHLLTLSSILGRWSTFREPSNSSSDNWNQLRDVLRTYFPQLDSSLNIGKCCNGDVFELSVAAALSVGALIAQDFSKSSTSPGQELSGRLKALCEYAGPEVGAGRDPPPALRTPKTTQTLKCQLSKLCCPSNLQTTSRWFFQRFPLGRVSSAGRRHQGFL